MSLRPFRDLGQHIRASREAASLSLSALAERLRVTKGYLSKVEAGRTKPSAYLSKRLAKALGISEYQLLLAAGHLIDDIQRIGLSHTEDLREQTIPYAIAPSRSEARASLLSADSDTHRYSGPFRIENQDCLLWLTRREANSIHAVVTDPPYGVKEYTASETSKLRSRKGGVWRIPPALGGYERSPLPRFTVLSKDDLDHLRRFFFEWAGLLLRAMVPGAHLIIATNPLVSHHLYRALEAAGLEKRGEIIRLVQTLRGGDRPKNAHDEFSGVSVMPRSGWEPWGLFRKPCEGRVQDNLRKWKTGGLRRISEDQPFFDVIRSSPTRSEERSLAPHPSLKPQALMRQLVRASLPLGEGVVLDPFMGAGSTIAAAASLGYESIGVELDRSYFDLAQEAIPKLTRLSLGAASSSPFGKQRNLL